MWHHGAGLYPWPDMGRWYSSCNVEGFFAAPDFSLLFSLDLINSLTWSCSSYLCIRFYGYVWRTVDVCSFEAAHLTDENGEPRNIKRSDNGCKLCCHGRIVWFQPWHCIYRVRGRYWSGGRTGLAAITEPIILPFYFSFVTSAPSIATAQLVLVGLYMIVP
jgi:AGZA family xanthine/uracil permease-like MFS transporter